jgi:flagellin-like protein
LILISPKRRRGVSEVLAAVITIAITLIAGAALYGFINGQAANSENSLGVANAANVNFLNERFVVPQVAFAEGGETATVYIYNNGQIENSFASVEVYCFISAGLPCRSDLDVTFYVHTGSDFAVDNNDIGKAGCNVTANALESHLLSAFRVPVGSVSLVSFTLPQWSCTSTGPFASGSVYGFQVVGEFGNIVTYYQEM